MSENIKNCPFCGRGGIAELRSILMWVVWCPSCCCQTAEYSRKQDAIDAWNRRVENKELIEKIRKIKKARWEFGSLSEFHHSVKFLALICDVVDLIPFPQDEGVLK